VVSSGSHRTRTNSGSALLIAAPARGTRGWLMEIVLRLCSAIRKIQTAVSLAPRVRRAAPRERSWRTVNSANPSVMRLQILWRDRYRCRCCGQRGDDVTLEAWRTQPNATAIEQMLTLCHRCRNLADEAVNNVSAVPGFSQLLLRPFCVKPDRFSRI